MIRSWENTIETASAQSPLKRLVGYFYFGIHALQTVIRETEKNFEHVTKTLKVLLKHLEVKRKNHAITVL